MTSYKRLKILVVTSRYMLSGVALAQTRFAQSLARLGHDVTMMIGRVDRGLQVPVQSGVTNVIVDADRTLGLALPVYRFLREEKPDIVFSAEDHLNVTVLIAAILARSRTKISGSSRVTPFDTYSNTPLSKRWILKQLARATAWRADALTCVSDDMVSQYRQVFPAGKHQRIYNIVDSDYSRARLAERASDDWLDAADAHKIVCVGSLAEWKRFDTAIAAAAVLRDRGHKIRMLIIGEGPDRNELQAQIDHQELGDVVKLAGHKPNPLPYFRMADISLLTSRVEGMPNVLIEGMMAGCTPVATDCPTGPREILQGGKYGYLATAGDPVSIADAIEQAIERPIDSNALAEAITPFREDLVVAHHFDILGLGDSTSR